MFNDVDTKKLKEDLSIRSIREQNLERLISDLGRDTTLRILNKVFPRKRT